jgi:ABC-type dipeptide/oligopeptide/nickel transport system ATPase component
MLEAHCLNNCLALLPTAAKKATLQVFIALSMLKLQHKFQMAVIPIPAILGSLRETCKRRMHVTNHNPI